VVASLLLNRGEEELKRADLGRLDEVVVEAGLTRAAAVFVLSPAASATMVARRSGTDSRGSC
jgi:hypothetical protein